MPLTVGLRRLFPVKIDHLSLIWWVSPLTLSKLACALDVEVYELFKPENTEIKEIKGVIDRLSADIRELLSNAADDLRR